MLKSAHKFILDILFPINCLFCKRYGDWICNDCFKKINILPEQVCPYCERSISPAGRICQNCKEKFLGKNQKYPLDALVVSVKYNQSGISHLIHYFKYNFIKDLGNPLAKIISQAIILHDLPLPDLIIPVPLHPKRLRWRGFNQSEILAHNISGELAPGLTILVAANLIVRKKYTPAQMKIKSYQERQKNVKNIFAFNKDFLNLGILKNKTILLVDDVSTTGATLFECAQVLKDFGAKKVYGAVIARQEIKKV